jgi:Rad52/22 family double-strand break repair protein
MNDRPAATTAPRKTAKKTPAAEPETPPVAPTGDADGHPLGEEPDGPRQVSYDTAYGRRYDDDVWPEEFPPAAVWAALTRPFDADEIEKKPQPIRRGDDNKGRCEDTDRGRAYSADGVFCGGWHAPSVHLDYVGHAGITTRLNEVVGPDGWDWEPLAWTEDGLPRWSNGGMWIRLTIMGTSKMGFGDPGSNTGPNGIKECIGDALRNAAMRFGVGTYLWSKSERARAALLADDPAPTAPPTIEDLMERLDSAAAAQGIDRETITGKWREQHGGIPVEVLPILAPQVVLPLVVSIESWVTAQARQQSTESGT